MICHGKKTSILEYYWRSPFIRDPLGSIFWDPNIFIWTPRFSLGPPDLYWDPQIFIGDPQIFIGTPRFLLGTHYFCWGPLDFRWRPHILIGDSIFSLGFSLGTPNTGVSNENLGSSINIRGLLWKSGDMQKIYGFSNENLRSTTKIWRSPTKIWVLQLESGVLQWNYGGLQRKSEFSIENLSSPMKLWGSPMKIWWSPTMVCISCLKFENNMIIKANYRNHIWSWHKSVIFI